jgi:hypothetical protein
VSRESVSACCKTATTALILANAGTAVPITGGAALGNGAACDAPLAGSGRGSRQRFCSSTCRTAFHTAARRRAESDVAAGTITVADLRNAPREACTLSGRTEPGQPMGGIGPEQDVPYGPLIRFLVEVPASTVDGLVRLGFLTPHERGDLPSILAGVKRIGWNPEISRIA